MIGYYEFKDMFLLCIRNKQSIANIMKDYICIYDRYDKKRCTHISGALVNRHTVNMDYNININLSKRYLENPKDQIYKNGDVVRNKHNKNIIYIIEYHYPLNEWMKRKYDCIDIECLNDRYCCLQYNIDNDILFYIPNDNNYSITDYDIERSKDAENIVNNTTVLSVLRNTILQKGPKISLDYYTEFVDHCYYLSKPKWYSFKKKKKYLKFDETKIIK